MARFSNIICSPPKEIEFPSVLKILPLVDGLAITSRDNLFSDTTGTKKVIDGSFVRRINELKNGQHILWQSSDTIRRSYLQKIYGSRHDLHFPQFKNPVGDIPHISIFNMFDTVFYNTPFTAVPSPFTVGRVVRRRTSVQDESMSPAESIGIKETSGNRIEINNSTTGFVSASGSSPLSPDVWTHVMAEDNGVSSKIYFDNVQNGSNFTLNAGNLTQLGIGTISHVYEHDLCLLYRVNRILTTNERNALHTEIANIIPLGTRVNKPFAYNISVTFNGVDTFNATVGNFNQGDDALSANTALDEIEWIHRTNIADANGYTFLDGQKLILGATGSSLKRSSYPSYFITPGDGNAWVAARIKRYNTITRSNTDIPLRSQYVNDNVTGTPDGTYAPKLSSVVINDSLKTRLVLTYISGSGTLSNTSSNASDFTLFVNNSATPINSMSFAGGNVLNLDVASPLTYTSAYVNPLRLQLIQGSNPLRDTNGKICENFITGIFTNISNSIVGPVTIKGNITHNGNDTTATGFININGGNAWNTTGSKASSMVDINGVSSSIGLTLVTAGGNKGPNSAANSPGGVLPTSSNYPDTNINTRGCGTEDNGSFSFKFTGLGANKTYDLNLVFFKDNGFRLGGAFTVNISGSGATTYNNSSLVEVVNNSLTANSSGESGNIVVSASGNFGVNWNGFILTQYP
jgi:hypothetical protein